MERELFTRHGLHLNKRGKEKMAERLASSIHQIMEPVKKHSEAIPMPLNETVPDQQNQEMETTQINSHSSDGTKQSEVCPRIGNDNLPVQLNKERETIQINPIPTGGIQQDNDTRRKRRLPNRNEDFFIGIIPNKARAKITNKQVTKKNDDIDNQIKIFHQNIRGIKGKINKFRLQLLTEEPHVICLTEHHLKDHEIEATPISNYNLGVKYCRKILKNGGVCIYIHENLKFTKINLLKHCKEQDIEIVAIKLKLKKGNLIIFSVYRAPSGNFDYFLNKLDNILNSLLKHKAEFIICGDFNINYLEINNKKNQLNNMFCTYNLTSTVYFPTRIVNNSATLIDNIFIDSRRKFIIKPFINGLSDHDAQLLIINIPGVPSNIEPTYIRNINKNTIALFQLQLSWEHWSDVFGNEEVNNMFNNFLNTYLRCYHSSFLKKEMHLDHNNNQWITNGIKISCQKKKELFMLIRHSNDVKFKIYYKQYCKVLSKVICAAKNYIITKLFAIPKIK